MTKTNTVRILDKFKIDYSVIEYDYNDDELDAVTVAGKIGFESERVFKTLVARSNNNDIFVFCIPGNYELDLKKASQAAGTKKIEMIKLKELLPLTGYIHGGCSPIGMKKSYPTFIEESAELFDTISISAGKRGMQIVINPRTLREITNASFAGLV
ncbi:MAG: Cys-tRNA(Pro) deacylase [Ignavibacteria bacterium]|jgi:Cys-tRNA(Pro)/Cys-tRNA(Cys) deacylase